MIESHERIRSGDDDSRPKSIERECERGIAERSGSLSVRERLLGDHEAAHDSVLARQIFLEIGKRHFCFVASFFSGQTGDVLTESLYRLFERLIERRAPYVKAWKFASGEYVRLSNLAVGQSNLL